MFKNTLLLCAILPWTARGHATMQYPPSRVHTTLAGAGTCEGGGCFYFSQGCEIGCKRCSDKTSGDTCSEGPGGVMAPTLNEPSLRTFQDVDGYDWTKANPWRAPGFAPIASPCGLAGGGPTRHAANGAVAPPGVPQGFDMRDAPEGPRTVWPAGSAQEVAWSITANHGGGYAYRLCRKAGANESTALTEACFERGHLAYANATTSWIQYGADASSRRAIAAARVSTGTHPPGSAWTKNPIPACAGPSGGVGTPDCPAPQFSPPLPGLFGYGSAACFRGGAGAGGNCTRAQREYWDRKFSFNIIDSVRVPAELPAGEYALSWRWDAEQTPQVWAACADITVTA